MGGMPSMGGMGGMAGMGGLGGMGGGIAGMNMEGGETMNVLYLDLETYRPCCE